MAQTARVVVPVLGMHRSGTSLTTGLLSALGVDLSEDLMPPTEANAMGYFESVGIRETHDELLAALGSAWNSSTTLSPFAANWWKSDAVEPFKRRLTNLVRAELQRVRGIWGFKDPRTARLLPLWNEIFAELNLEPRYVIVGRHPMDVSQSLEARDGLHRLYSELLWLEHVCDAVANVKTRPVAIVEYSNWFADPQTQMQHMISSLGLSVDAGTSDAAITRYVSNDLRHHSNAVPACALPYSREVFQALVRRDRENLEMLAELFQVTSVFTNKVTGFALRSVKTT